ncbi:MAG: 2,3-diketo-5-methylthiopentyl-1-phosphate enolase [Oscillatoria sp. SIO1A7]|nr:2,3-diketo-5-methylthiopentyl-1-phosphate enolase [Oscillatoria sp. SIO1A7]
MAIEVDYRFPPGVDPQKQAKIIAIGQTAGTWDSRYAHWEESFQKHLAKVISGKVETTGESVATISFPEENVENDIPSLLTAIFGKYSMAGPAKVMAVRLPEGYGKRPKFGISGIREILGVRDRPLVMAIFKPALGISAQEHANILDRVANAGLDLIKDDEIMGNIAGAETLERLRACREVIDRIKQTTGRTVLYATNVTSDIGKTPLESARILVREGANALLLNVLSYGFSVLESLAADPEINVPIFAHPALAGAWCGAPNYGMAYSVVLGTLMAYAGADAVLYPSHYGSLPFEAEEEGKIRDILRSRNVFPVPSAGIKPGIVPKANRDYGSDVILNAGTGIMDHPDGAAAGVTAFFEALEWNAQGKSFELNSLPEGALRRAIEKWGT